MKMILFILLFSATSVFSQRIPETKSNKEADTLISKKFVFRNGALISGKDFHTGLDVSYKFGEIWTVDTILHDYDSTKFFEPYEIIFKNIRGNYIDIPGKYFERSNEDPSIIFFSVTEFHRLQKKYGLTFFKEIFENTVSIGMSEEMVLFSLGNPYTKNTTETANTISTQWVYPDGSIKYVYFTNGKVRALQY